MHARKQTHTRAALACDLARLNWYTSIITRSKRKCLETFGTLCMHKERQFLLLLTVQSIYLKEIAHKQPNSKLLCIFVFGNVS